MPETVNNAIKTDTYTYLFAKDLEKAAKACMNAIEIDRKKEGKNDLYHYQYEVATRIYYLAKACPLENQTVQISADDFIRICSFYVKPDFNFK